MVSKPVWLLHELWGGLILHVKLFIHPAFISALEMILDEINGDGESHVSGEMAKRLEMQEIMSLLPACHTAG